MSKKWKVVLTVIASTVLVALIGGSVALADNSQQNVTGNPYLAAVATKLGVTEQVLTNAVSQAHKELANEVIDNALANAVTKGTITQAESNAIKAWLAEQPAPGDMQAMKDWWNQRPEVANSRIYKGMIWKYEVARRHGWCTGNFGINNDEFIAKVATILGKPVAVVQSAFQTAAADMKSVALQRALDNAVANGKLTQEEANQIKSWWDSRPAALDKVTPGARGCGPGGAFRGMMGRW
jgi:hypothetical protein